LGYGRTPEEFTYPKRLSHQNLDGDVFTNLLHDSCDNWSKECEEEDEVEDL
jgi:hypothetical protein